MIESAEEIKYEALKSDKGNVTEIPLMWTIYGNRPVASFDVEAKWAEDDKAFYCTICFYDKVTRELVRTDPNVRLKKGVGIEGELAKL